MKSQVSLAGSCPPPSSRHPGAAPHPHLSTTMKSQVSLAGSPPLRCMATTRSFTRRASVWASSARVAAPAASPGSGGRPAWGRMDGGGGQAARKGVKRLGCTVRQGAGVRCMQAGQPSPLPPPPPARAPRALTCPVAYEGHVLERGEQRGHPVRRHVQVSIHSLAPGVRARAHAPAHTTIGRLAGRQGVAPIEGCTGSNRPAARHSCHWQQSPCCQAQLPLAAIALLPSTAATGSNHPAAQHSCVVPMQPGPPTPM